MGFNWKRALTAVATGGLSETAYRPLKSVAESVSGAVSGAGAGSDSSTTTVNNRNVPARDSDSQSIWNQYMSSINNLGSNLSGQSTYLDNAFSDYSKSIGSANNEYQGTLNNLISGLNNNANKISFGMEGSSPVSFTSRQDRNNASTIADLAANILSSKSTLPTATYAEAQANNPYTAKLSLYDALQNQINTAENRRYGVSGNTTTSTVDSGNPGLLAQLTGLTGLIGAGSELGGALSGVGTSLGLGETLSSLLGLGAIAVV